MADPHTSELNPTKRAYVADLNTMQGVDLGISSQVRQSLYSIGLQNEKVQSTKSTTWQQCFFIA